MPIVPLALLLNQLHHPILMDQLEEHSENSTLMKEELSKKDEELQVPSDADQNPHLLYLPFPAI